VDFALLLRILFEACCVPVFSSHIAEVKEQKYKLLQAQKELASFLNKFIHDIAFIADEEVT
jgi:hypothetical protein